jgi:hypothetical protein
MSDKKATGYGLQATARTCYFVRDASELYQLTRKYQIASLPLQQRGPLQRIHAPAAFGRPVHQKDRKRAFPEQSLRSTSPVAATASGSLACRLM